jgi:hypothetical protein
MVNMIQWVSVLLLGVSICFHGCYKVLSLLVTRVGVTELHRNKCPLLLHFYRRKWIRVTEPNKTTGKLK